MTTDTWKLQDAKARLSEVVRRARAGNPQRVTLHGKDAVIVADPERFDVTPKPPQEETMAGFIERSKKYRGPAMKLGRRKMKLQMRERLPFDEDGR
jgi:antitoxin Phd